MTTLDRSSRNRLTERLLSQFAGDTLFDALARAVCRAGCLPRKELYEAWEVARRVRRRFRGGRIVDLASGHGLLAMILLLLDDSSPEALEVDRRIPDVVNPEYSETRDSHHPCDSISNLFVLNSAARLVVCCAIVGSIHW